MCILTVDYDSGKKLSIHLWGFVNDEVATGRQVFHVKFNSFYLNNFYPHSLIQKEELFKDSL